MTEGEQSSHHSMPSHLFKGFMCETSRLSGGGVGGSSRDVQGCFGLSAVPGFLVCSPGPLSALLTMLCALDSSPSSSQLGSTKGGSPGEKMEEQESKVRGFVSQHGHFRGHSSCQVTLSIQFSLSLGTCNYSFPWPGN